MRVSLINSLIVGGIKIGSHCQHKGGERERQLSTDQHIWNIMAAKARKYGNGKAVLFPKFYDDKIWVWYEIGGNDGRRTIVEASW